MDIRIDSLLAGAKRAEGLVVVIDVYRAFTTASVALERGVRKLILVSETDEALLLRRQGVADLCAGEVGGRRPEDFDYGNSPSELSHADVADRVLILSTRAGTVGVNAAWHADEIYGAALINAKATADVIRARQPDLVTLVPMGFEGRIRSDEDEICAVYLKNLILGESPDAEAVARLVAGCRESRKFDDPAQPWFQPGDRDLALALNRIPFAIRVARRDRLLVAAKATGK